MNQSQPKMKVVFLIVLLLIVLPLALLVLVQFAPRKAAPAPEESVEADSPAPVARSVSAQERRARRENRVERQETTVTVMEEPEQEPFFEEVGAISPYATRSKQATPYAPGTVPGDSGVVVQAVGSPNDPMSGPQPADPWNGVEPAPIRPNMGIGGVRRIDPNDPFFQQEIPNPFAN